MKHITHVFLVIAACVCGDGCTAERAHVAGPSSIGDSFEAWEFHSADPEAKIQDVWSLKDGVLICRGEPLSYLYTKKDYSDFVLRLKWRWPPEKEPGKGGVLIRMTGQHKIWPKSLEAQLNAGDAGAFWGLAGYGLTGPAERMRSLEHEKFGKLTNVKKTKALEKPAGQWNSYEIIAEGDTVTLLINGEQVNRATGCDLDAGRICLTSEGDEIHFKDVMVTAVQSK
ncbi:MAG: DUF1080 domain-containing protein [Planctomycetota bacterium]|nr:DUF1080 domain-containing protein [Planctomycetota bacterium]